MKSALIIVWEFPPGPGGIGQHAFSLAHALSRKGIGLEILTSGDYAGVAEIKKFDAENRALNIKRITGSRMTRYILRLFASISRARRGKPSAIFLSGKSALWLGIVLKLFLRKGTNLYAFVHGSEVKPSAFISRHVTYMALRNVANLICVSNFTKTLLPATIQELGSVLVLPNGLSLGLMPKSIPPLFPAIAGRGSPRLLTVGKISQRKGQHRVVKALPYLRTLWPDIHYHIVGLDHNREALFELAKKIDVMDQLTIHGRLKSRDILYSAYRSSDVFIMLSENQVNGDVEGFGIAILEANYFGIPAIGSRGCGIEDAIIDGLNGYLVDGDDPREIGEALKKCLEEHSLKKGAGDWAREHDWDLLITDLLKQS